MCENIPTYPEIDVTREMLAAGEEIVLETLGGSDELVCWDERRAFVEKVYRAMHSARGLLTLPLQS